MGDENIYIVEQIRVLKSRPAIGGCNLENPRDRLGLVKSKTHFSFFFSIIIILAHINTFSKLKHFI